MKDVQTKEFGDWAVVFWKKGSKTLSIAQNQGDPGTSDYWMVGTTTRQFDYESGWLPNKEWSTAIKGHFQKDKAIQMAKEQVMKGLKENKMKNLKESVEERYKIDISPIQGSGEEMLSFQEMIDEVLENMAGMDNIIEIDEEFFERKYQYYLRSHPRKMRMGPSRYEDDEAWMLAMKSTLNNDLSMLDDGMIYDYYMSGRYNERSDEYKAIWDKCVHEIEKKDSDDGSRFYDRWDFTTPRVNESKKVNKKKIQESRKPFTSDIPNNLLEIQNNMEDVFEVHSLSIAASESANGLARDILTWTGTKVGELLFTPASYYMVGPREDIYWEGSTLEEFEADVTDLSYTL